MSRSGLFVSVPGAIAALALLVWTVSSLLQTIRGAVITSVPILSEQRVAFDRAGGVVLNVEGRVLSRSAAGLRFALARAGDTVELNIPLRPVLFRAEVSSASRARLELYSFAVPSAGTYILRISGVDPGANYSDDAIVFTRPIGIASVFHILLLVVLGAALVGSLVVSGFALKGR